MGKQPLKNLISSKVDSVYYWISDKIKVTKARSEHEKSYLSQDPNPLITVYTPTYNRGEILVERAVQTVLQQTYKNIEYIIIGDHCTDNTEELVKKVGDPRIRFYNIPHRSYRYPPTAENHWLAGPVIAANQALSMVTGQWIARLDDDDTWTPDHLELSLKFAQDHNFEFVSSLYEEVRNNNKTIVQGIGIRDPYFTRKKTAPKHNNPLIGGTSSWFYRSYLKSIQYNLNCWKKSWNRVNDMDMIVRLHQAGVRIGFLDKVTMYMIPRPGESTVGLEAYTTNQQEKEDHFKFSA